MQVPFRSRRLLRQLPAAQKMLSAMELRMNLGITQRKRLRLIFLFLSVSNLVSRILESLTEHAASVSPAATSLRSVLLFVLTPPPWTKTFIATRRRRTQRLARRGRQRLLAAAGGARLCGETKRALQRLADAWPGQPVADADLATFCDLWGLDTTRAAGTSVLQQPALASPPRAGSAARHACPVPKVPPLATHGQEGSGLVHLGTFDCRDLDLLDPFYGCEVEPEAPEGELREEQARVLALRAAALLGLQVARVCSWQAQGQQSCAPLAHLTVAR